MATNTPQHRMKLAQTSVWALDRIESFFPYLSDDDRAYLIKTLEDGRGAEQQLRPENKRGPRGATTNGNAAEEHADPE